MSFIREEHTDVVNFREPLTEMFSFGELYIMKSHVMKSQNRHFCKRVSFAIASSSNAKDITKFRPLIVFESFLGNKTRTRKLRSMHSSREVIVYRFRTH